ncbi:MAG: GNAT family N-acetyltransferase [Planctomycetes bacterium]|nr:GNAT family N-acetyltransferase [Planctomycetota bacterium]
MAAIAQILATIREQIFFENVAILFVRSMQDPLDVQISQKIVIRELGGQDFSLFEPIVSRSDVEWYRLLLKKGRTCLIALKDDRLAAYVWLMSHIDPRLDRIYVPLTSGDIYIGEIRTMPDFRRQGLQKMLLKRVIKWAQERGYSRIVSMSGIHNKASIKLHDKLGYQSISRMTRTRVLFLLRFRYTPNLFGKAGNFWMLY